MIYKVYPLLLWFFCALTFTAGTVLVVYLKARWALLLLPVPSALFGWFCTSFFVRRYPRIRYIDNAEIDGLGHVRQPIFDVIVPFLLITMIAAVLVIEKSQ
jgi:hypothetical protein